MRCLLLILCLIPGLSYAAQAEDYLLDEENEIVGTFLSSHTTETEKAATDGYIVSDLNADGIQEVTLVWMILGPTYWRSYLSVLTQNEDGNITDSTLQLQGNAKLNNVVDGVIYVDQNLPDAGDPICCPSLNTQVKYQWHDKEISELQ